MSMRTPLKSARNLGSAKSGTDHFWKQRVTAVANVVLGLYIVWVIASLAGAPHAIVKAALARPLVSLPLLALVVSATVHMRLGMQTIIEDYVHHEGTKILLVLLNTFFAGAVALTSLYAILKLSFGA